MIDYAKLSESDLLPTSQVVSFASHLCGECAVFVSFFHLFLHSILRVRNLNIRTRRLTFIFKGPVWDAL